MTRDIRTVTREQLAAALHGGALDDGTRLCPKHRMPLDLCPAAPHARHADAIFAALPQPAPGLPSAEWHTEHLASRPHGWPDGCTVEKHVYRVDDWPASGLDVPTLTRAISKVYGRPMREGESNPDLDTLSEKVAAEYARLRGGA